MKIQFWTIFLLSKLTHFVFSINTYTPTWITSNYIQADANRVINNVKTGNSSTPSAMIPFTFAFAVVPNLGYGISNYQGDDWLGQQMFEVNRTALTVSSFSVKMQISGFTHLWLVQVRFIAISKSFPHHLNSFDNVPVNYNNGALTTITIATPTLQTYNNVINYTTQATAAGSTYTSFSLPLTNNKIILFMTSFFMSAVNDLAGTPYLPLNLQVSAVPISTQTYRMSASFCNGSITRLHFSQVIFDQVEVQSSGLYKLIYEKRCYTSGGGFYPFQAQFLRNFMFGFVDFSTSRVTTIIHFQTIYTTVGGLYGAQMPVSIPRNSSNLPVSRYCFNIFYLKTWTCPSSPQQTFYNPVTDNCTACPIVGCSDCLNLTNCSTCQSGRCDICTLTGCINCATLTTCSNCNQTGGYILLPDYSCYLCNSSENYFPNTTTEACQLCTISHCTNCTNLTICRACDTGLSYYLNSAMTCSFCNSSLNYFIDPVLLDCNPCNVTNCIVCDSLTTCSQCNQTANYFINSSDSLCYLCSPTFCSDCLNATACSLCNIGLGYTINLNTLLCQLCPIVGCINCSDTSTCVQCNYHGNYVLSGVNCTQCIYPLFANNTSQACQPCLISGCLVCSNLTACTTCDTNSSFYLLIDSSCGYCNSSNDQFINMVNLDCQLCSLIACTNCSSLTQCVQCYQTDGYFLNYTDFHCYPCAIPNCLTCSNLSACLICDSIQRYNLNQITLLCQLCPTGLFPNTSSNLCESCSVPNCLICSFLTICNTCNYNDSFYLTQNFTCQFCDSQLNSFINYTNLGCQVCLIPNCINCSSLTICQTCNSTAKYLLNSTDDLCYLCTIPNCIICQNFTACSVCDEGSQYFLNFSTGLCQPCLLVGCLNCSSLTKCFQCDSANNFGFDYTSVDYSQCGSCNVSCICDGYEAPWDTINLKCNSICGDGLIRNDEECDDNNTESYDGCSSLCTVQRYWACDGGQPTICNQTLYIEGQFIEIVKQGCNGFKITAKSELLLEEIRQNIHIINSGVTITKIQQIESLLQIHAQYTRDIVEQPIILHFSPGQLFNITYNPSIPALYYTPDQCDASKSIHTILSSVQISSYIILLISLFSCKIVGLELFSVLQLSYFTLSNHNFLNMYLQPFKDFQTFNGLNLDLYPESQSPPQNLIPMNMHVSFLNNCNLMLFLLASELLISIIFYAIAKVIKLQKLDRISKKMLKQGLLTFVMFNAFNISFSAGVQSRFANKNDPMYLPSVVLMVIAVTISLICAFSAVFTSRNHYGEYQNKFKANFVCLIYIPLSLLYRMLIGAYSAVRSEYEYGTLIILAFSIAFVMYFIINLPFRESIQNYRCGLINITALVILATTNYYRGMKSTTPLSIKGKIFTPAIIQICLIVACVIVSFIVLGYEIFQLVRDCMRRRRIKQENVTLKQSKMNLTTQTLGDM